MVKFIGVKGWKGGKSTQVLHNLQHCALSTLLFTDKEYKQEEMEVRPKNIVRYEASSKKFPKGHKFVALTKNVDRPWLYVIV